VGKWSEGLKQVSLGKLTGGAVVAWLVCIFIVGWLLTVPKFDEVARSVVVGEVTSLAMPIEDKQPALEFTLRDQPLRFRILSAIFVEALKKELPPELRPGVTVRLEVPREKYEALSKQALERVAVVYPDSIRIGDRDVLTLAASRKWHDENRRMAWLAAPVFVTLASLLSVLAFIRARLR